MAEVDAGDVKFDLHFSDLLWLLENRSSTIYIRDENDTQHILTRAAHRKLLLAAAINLLKVGDTEDAIMSLVSEITKLVPEMEDKGWLKLDYLARQEKEKLKTQAITRTLPDGFNATQELVVPEIPQSGDSFFELKWLIPVDGSFARDERICTITDSTQEYGLTTSHDGIIVDQKFRDDDLVKPGDLLGLMALKVSVD